VESVDTQGLQVQHLLEVHKQFLIAVGLNNQFAVFHSRSQRQPFERVTQIDYSRCLAGAVIAIEPLKQFSSQRKAYFVVITYGKQVSLLQFSFHITPHRMEASQVQLAKLFSETITNVQPFSLRVLYNSSVEVTTSGTQTGQKGGKEDKCLKSIEQKQEIILGCSSGTLILYELKMQKRSIAVVGGVQMPPPQKALYQTPPESLQEHRRVALQEKEPLLYIEECLGPHQTNTVLFGTLSGTIYLLNHRSKPAQTIQKVDLSQ
jgi:hypothetical protein